jgi:hypothetical protein
VKTWGFWFALALALVGLLVIAGAPIIFVGFNTEKLQPYAAFGSWLQGVLTPGLLVIAAFSFFWQRQSQNEANKIASRAMFIDNLERSMENSGPKIERSGSPPFSLVTIAFNWAARRQVEGSLAPWALRVRLTKGTGATARRFATRMGRAASIKAGRPLSPPKNPKIVALSGRGASSTLGTRANRRPFLTHQGHPRFGNKFSEAESKFETKSDGVLSPVVGTAGQKARALPQS